MLHYLTELAPLHHFPSLDNNKQKSHYHNSKAVCAHLHSLMSALLVLCTVCVCVCLAGSYEVIKCMTVCKCHAVFSSFNKMSIFLAYCTESLRKYSDILSAVTSMNY